MTETERYFANPAAHEFDKRTLNLVASAILARGVVRRIRDKEQRLDLNPHSLRLTDPEMAIWMRELINDAAACLRLIGEGE